jgi:WD40 repeat protein
LGTVRFHYPKPIHTVAFAPDGQALLVFAHDYPNSALRLWRIADGKELARLDRKDANYPDAWYTRGVCFTPDGMGIVLRRENTVELLDRQTGKSLHILNGKHKFGAMALSPDGKVVALASLEEPRTTVSFWVIATGRLRSPLRLDSEWCFGLQYSSDGKRLLTASRGKKAGGVVEVWEVGSGKRLHQVEVESGFYAAFSPDGQTVASRSGEEAISLASAKAKDEIRVLQVRDGATVCRFKPPYNGRFASFAFTRDGKALLTIAPGHTPCLWDAVTGKQTRVFSGPPSRAQKLGEFSADGKRFALIVGSQYRENSVRLWNVETGEEIRPFEGHTGQVSAVAFAPDGKILASGSSDCTVRLWEAGTGRALRCLQSHQGQVLDLAFSPDGGTLASASTDGTTRLWRVADGRELAKLEGPGWAGAGPSGLFARQGMKLVFATDGKTLYGVDETAGYRAWDVPTGRVLRRKQFGTPGHHLIGLSADGGTALAYWPNHFEKGEAGEALSLWDVATGQHERTLPRRVSVGNRHDMACVAAELSRDGRLVAASSRSYEHFKFPPDTLYGYPALRIWERLSGQEILTLEAFPRALAFAPDGKLIAGNDDGGDPKGWDLVFHRHMGSVYLWDTLTGKRRKTFAHHAAEVRSLTFAPDGKVLASGSVDQTVLLWDCARVLADDKPPGDPSAKQLKAWWESLADARALVARQAMAQLVQCPAAATRLLAARLKPASAPDPKQVAALIRDLSDARFATRQRATDALAQLGELALPALNKALAGDPDVEASRRLRQVLSRATNIGYRRCRAVAVLEAIADPAAARVLESLGKGLPASAQTAEALGALRRLCR